MIYSPVGLHINQSRTALWATFYQSRRRVPEMFPELGTQVVKICRKRTGICWNWTSFCDVFSNCCTV